MPIIPFYTSFALAFVHVQLAVLVLIELAKVTFDIRGLSKANYGHVVISVLLAVLIYTFRSSDTL